MVNVSFNLASLSGFAYLIWSLIYLALKVILITRQSRNWSNFSLTREIFLSVLATTILLFVGTILITYGWRFDPIMQLGQLFQTILVIYISIKDILMLLGRTR